MVVSNKNLALVLVFAIVVSVAATFIGLYSFTDKLQVSTIVTGRATSDTGIINLTIAESLNIDVDNLNDILQYKNCTPNSTGLYVDLGNTAYDGLPGANCTGDNDTQQFIVVNNIGNVDANVTIQGECNTTDFIGSSSAIMNLSSTGCLPGAEEFDLTLPTPTEYYICDNVTKSGGADDTFNVTSRAWIPNNAVGSGANCGGDNLNTLTFTARKL